MTKSLNNSSKRTPNTKDMNRLTDKQRRFIHEFKANPFDGVTGAASRAGYSSPAASASRLIRNPIIKRALSAFLVRQEERLEKTSDELVERMWQTEQFDPYSIFKDDGNGNITLRQLEDMDPKARQQITSIRVKERRRPTDDGEEVNTDIEIKWLDKMENRKLLANHYGITNDKKSETTVSLNFIADMRAKIENPDSVEVIDDTVIDGRVVG